LLDALLVEPIEMVDATQEDFARTMPLNRGNDNVIDLDCVGQGDNGTRRRLDHDRLVVETEIADIFNAGFRQII
jgi:hypothetical protein